MDILNNLEGVVALSLALITVGVTYAKVVAKIENIEKLTNSRIDQIEKRIDVIDEKHQDISEVLVEIKVAIGGIKKDIDHILEKLK